MTGVNALRNRKRYGHLPAKVAEGNPWEQLCVDLIGPYTVERKGRKPLQLQAVTMIDPTTGWFEIIEYPDKRSIKRANLVEQAWLNRYPWPTHMTKEASSLVMNLKSVCKS